MFRKPTTFNQCREARQRGFSVIEITVVLLVIAIIAAFEVNVARMEEGQRDRSL